MDNDEQLLISDVVESEPMKGALGKPKWVSIQKVSDGLEVRLPKGVQMLTEPVHTNGGGWGEDGWKVYLYIPDENGRSEQGSSGKTLT